MITVHKFGDLIHWSKAPSDTVVQVGNQPMVHRVFELEVSNVCDDVFILECGVRAAKSTAIETADPVDCMACMIQRMSEVMEAEYVMEETAWAEFEELLP